MDRDYIVLTYSRSHALVNDEHPLNGEITTSVSGLMEETKFSNLTFLRMVLELSKVLKAHPELPVFIARAEHPNKFAVELDESTRTLMRDDPLAAARALSEPQRTVMVRGAHPKYEMGTTGYIMPEPVKAGYDTLADAFGALVYAKTRKTYQIESPISGRWTQLQRELATNKLVYIYIDKQIEVVSYGDRWAAFNVEDLLAINAPRYWLPRAWNTGSWISHDALKTKYEQFKKETSS